MTRSFWGFGYAPKSPQQPQQAQSQAQQPEQQSQQPEQQLHVPQSQAEAGVHQSHGQNQSQNQGNLIPPNGAFAPATTAVTQNQPSLSPFNGGAAAGGLGSGPQATVAATPSRGFAAKTANINIPETAKIQGKLRVRVSQGRGLDAKSATSSPYVIVQSSTSEHISRSATANTGGNGIAIPSSRMSSTKLAPGASGTQSAASSTHGSRSSGSGPAQTGGSPANPEWQDEAIFDVTSYNSDVAISVYDAGDNDRFLGYARIRPDFTESRIIEGWYALGPRADANESSQSISGQIHISLRFERTAHHQFGPSDFQVLRLIGKGTFGQVYQVRKRDSNRVYAMKVLSKRVIVREKEIAHTIGERDILVRTSGEGSAFLVGLKFSFQTKSDLYLITDYMSGGELFWHLQREGRFSEPRARFYIAELIIALEHLHNNDIVYRDLKPENILLDASGHVALCDFGLSKANLHNGTTNTFCGTTEYLAPEVLLDDKGYTKMVDFWSLGVLIFEMCCGWSPFYADDNQQMYKNIAFGKVRFPKDALSPEGRDFVKGLLNRNPRHRLGATNDARELMAHPFFNSIDWDLLKKKQIPPPYKPHVSSEDDTSNFDPEFTTASTSVLTRTMEAGASPLSPGIQDKFKGFTFVDDTLMDEYFKPSGKTPNTNAQAISASFRAPPPKMGRDEGIDLYDENEIQLSHSHYDSGIKHKFANENTAPQDEMMRMDEEDEDMMDDDRVNDDDRANYDDFVEGQGFEM